MFLPILLLAIGIANVSSQDWVRPQAKKIAPNYECVDSKKSEVRIYNNIAQKCPPNTFCNERYDLLPSETMPRPCISVTALCPYDCEDDFTTLVHNVSIKCNKFMVCNKEKTSCDMCLCDKNSFDCLDWQTANIDGMEFKCTRGKICNEMHAPPCTPCIDPTGPELLVSSVSADATGRK